MLTWLAFALALFAPWGALHYLSRLPYAPECPRCRAVTGQPPAPAGALDRLFGLLSATPVRDCARCGWAGRMRWRLAAQRAERTRTPRMG